MPTHNELDLTVGRSATDSLRSQDFAPSANARMRAITVTLVPTRLNVLLGPIDGEENGPSRNTTKIRLHPRDEDIWLRRVPEVDVVAGGGTLTQAQFEADGAYLRIGPSDQSDFQYFTLIMPDNPYLQVARAYPAYGSTTLVVVEEL
jgi:hypothetical protein